MKKRLLSVLLASALIGAAIPASAADIDSMTLEELKEAYKELETKYNALLEESGAAETETELGSVETDFEYSADGYTYKYLKNQVETIDGTDYVYVFFEYTNDSGQSAMPYYSLAVQAYQNGVELNSGSVYDTGIPEADNTMKSVQNGTTIEVAFPFELADKSQVSIEVRPMVIIGDMEIGEYTFDLE